MDQATGDWERVERTAVCRCDGRARYASVTATAAGDLLVLFSRQTASQQDTGADTLALCRSRDHGRTWSAPVTVWQDEGGEPRVLGTMTILRSGVILAPYVSWPKDSLSTALHLLRSEDEAESWSASMPALQSPFAWLQPAGRLLEQEDGTLVMAVHGTESQTDLDATIHGCGLLRSGDGGLTWNDFTWIVEGQQPVHGASASSLFSFESPAVQTLADGRWLAVVTARRLNRAGTGPTVVDEGPGSPQLICRFWSRDQGRTWTRPDQLAPGAWPGLAGVGTDTLLATTHWAAWGNMYLSVSADGLETLCRQNPLHEQAWLRGRLNRPQEVPLPPTVPGLGNEWALEHFGFPSLLPLGADEVVAVFNRPQRGEAQIEGPETRDIPENREMIEAVFYRRTKTASRRAAPSRPQTAAPAGRWVLAERFRTPVTGVLTQAPDGSLVGPIDGRISRSVDGGRTWKEIRGATFPKVEALAGAFGILRRGRWLTATTMLDGPAKESGAIRTGMRGGYPVFRSVGWVTKYKVVVSRSDDEGRSWHSGEPFAGPMLWAVPSASHFLEFEDGTVGLLLYGCVTEQEADSYSGSNCIVRSHDGGETWGDASFVFRTNPMGPDDFQCEPRFSEMDMIRRPGGRLIAFSRNEYMIMGPKGWGTTAVAESRDGGRTWEKTGASLVGVSQQSGLSLPDGGIALTYRSHSWQQPGVAVSYDEGRSFSYEMAGPYETINAFVTSPEEFVVFTAMSHRSDGAAAAYRLTRAREGCSAVNCARAPGQPEASRSRILSS